jgi:hypothetical protein
MSLPRDLERLFVADLGTYWDIYTFAASPKNGESPGYPGLSQWAVEESNLQPWD